LIKKKKFQKRKIYTYIIISTKIFSSLNLTQNQSAADSEVTNNLDIDTLTLIHSLRFPEKLIVPSSYLSFFLFFFKLVKKYFKSSHASASWASYFRSTHYYYETKRRSSSRYRVSQTHHKISQLTQFEYSSQPPSSNGGRNFLVAFLTFSPPPRYDYLRCFRFLLLFLGAHRSDNHDEQRAGRGEGDCQ